MFLFCSKLVALGTAAMEDLPFKVVRTNGTDEVLARAGNLLVGRAAFEKAASLYPQDRIELRHLARIIEKTAEG
jgi:hypothetical protein